MADWSLLPLVPLEEIFQLLEFKDRLSCTLVCRGWNDAFFSCPALVQKILFAVTRNRAVDELESLVRHSQRNYRHWAIELSDDESNGKINKCLAEAARRYMLKSLSLYSVLSPVVRCFQRNSALFRSITELSLELTVSHATIINCTHIGVNEVVFEQLKHFNYIQLYSGSLPTNLVLVFETPNLLTASIILETLADEEALYREYPLLELKGCTKLEGLEIDLKGRMWESFFTMKRLSLKHLIMRRASDEIEQRDWDLLFGNMPNLEQVELVYSNDAILAGLSRNCRKIRYLMLSSFKFEDGTFGEYMNWRTLRELHMDGWFQGILYSRTSTLRLENLIHLEWNYVDLSPSQNRFKIVAPEIGVLTIRCYDYGRFELSVGNHLQSIDMDYYSGHRAAPNFLNSFCLDNLVDLVLYINDSALELVGKLGKLTSLVQLEVICSTESRSFDISALFGCICSSCTGLIEFVVRNEHENELTLDYVSMLPLIYMQKLKVLSLQYITLLRVGKELRLKKLDVLDIRGCKVTGPDGIQANFPVVKDTCDLAV